MPEQANSLKCAGQGTIVIASDEEAVGSNPATPTAKQQVKGYARSRRDGLG
jgi:hypothetical protein